MTRNPRDRCPESLYRSCLAPALRREFRSRRRGTQPVISWFMSATFIVLMARTLAVCLIFSGEPGELGFVAGPEEVEDDPRLKVPAGALTISKQRYSCFAGTGLEQMLREMSVNRIVVTG
ncbi:MAG: isochorismatase family protein, partial [Mesorhizobium sp.]